MKKVDKYTALHLDEYRGVYSVVEGYADSEDQFKPSWCKREFGKDKIEKNSPVRVRIGDKAKAIEVALWMYQELTGKDIETPF